MLTAHLDFKHLWLRSGCLLYCRRHLALAALAGKAFQAAEERVSGTSTAIRERKTVPTHAAAELMSDLVEIAGEARSEG